MYAGRFILYYCLSITKFNILGIPLDVLLAQTLMKMLVVGAPWSRSLSLVSFSHEPAPRVVCMYSTRFHHPGIMAVQKLYSKDILGLGLIFC
jgi:hypothetical protein